MYNSDMEKIQKKYAGKRLSPLKSIKAYCKEMCCAGDIESWKNCTYNACFLFKYRLGQGNRVKKPKHSPITQNFEKNDKLQANGGNNASP